MTAVRQPPGAACRSGEVIDLMIYFPKRVGVRWEVWNRYEDHHADPANGATEWQALWGVRFWRWLNAARTASDMQQAYNIGRCGDEYPIEEDAE